MREAARGEEYSGFKNGERPMKVERLEELQQDVNGQRSLSIQDCAALIGEVWRLRAVLSAKDLEVSYLRHNNDQLQAELDRMAETTRLLRADNDQLKAVHGLPNCYLENRWSNCAVRMRKRGEIDNNGNHVNRNHAGLRNLTSKLVRNSIKHKSI
jgi:hypothetical protein